MTEKLRSTEQALQSQLGRLAQFWYYRDLASLEKNRQSSEIKLDPTKKNFFVLIPGMNGRVQDHFALQREIEELLGDEYQVQPIPLGRSWTDFASLVDLVEEPLDEALQYSKNLNSQRKVIVFGHSHGGRVGAQVVSNLSKKFPEVSWSLITAGTPIVRRPSHRFYMVLAASMVSPAFREWPNIDQPDTQLVDFVSLYSAKDRIVLLEDALEGLRANEKIVMPNFSHGDFINPQKMMPWVKKFLDK